MANGEEINLDELRKFLIASNRAGYASDGESRAKKESDHSKTLVFAQGDFSSHDNWFGGEPYGGRTVVFYLGRPVWMIVYYGSVDPAFENIEGVYSILRKALMHNTEKVPLRGPKKLEEEGFRYENSCDGDLGIYSGEEIIFYNNKPVYEATYSGGLVDVRRE